MPFSYDETREEKNLWLRGSLPLAYLAETEGASLTWRKFYIKSFLEQDIPNLGFKIAPLDLSRRLLQITLFRNDSNRLQ